VILFVLYHHIYIIFEVGYMTDKRAKTEGLRMGTLQECMYYTVNKF